MRALKDLIKEWKSLSPPGKIFSFWCFGLVPVALYLISLTLDGNFGKNYKDPIVWLLKCNGPSFTVMAMTLATVPRPKRPAKNKSPVHASNPKAHDPHLLVVWATWFFAVISLAVTYYALVAYPFIPGGYSDMFEHSAWIMGIIHSVFSGFYARMYAELRKP